MFRGLNTAIPIPQLTYPHGMVAIHWGEHLSDAAKQDSQNGHAGYQGGIEKNIDPS